MTQQEPEVVAGRYELAELVGQGGMGRVWRARDRQLFGREVAVKEILFPPGLEDEERARLLGRFAAEARAVALLNHPSVVTVHDVAEHRGSPVIVMEFLRGRSLAAALRADGPLPPARVAEIGVALLGALREAHAAGIVHRDLKPDNVLLTRDRVVLTDFGIAHLADATTRLSHSGAVVGTPHYMPPEQLEGKHPAPANDLWALGATLYHAVEGRPPFDADGLHALALAVFTRPHLPPARAGGLAPVLDALLAKDPGQRADADRAAALLAAATESLTAPQDPAPAAHPRRTGQSTQQRTGLRIAALAVALAVLGGGVLAWRLTGSGHGGGGNTGSTGSGLNAAPPPDGKAVKVVIGLDAPLTGALAATGQAVKDAADLAVKDANRTGAVPGVQFELRALDDRSQPADGRANATRLAEDGAVLGVVGPVNSSVAQSMLPSLDAAGLATVSPVATNGALTLGPDWAAGRATRQYGSFFRVCANDVEQGATAADHLVRTAKRPKVFLVDDGSAYGSGIVARFTAELDRIGGTAAGAEHVRAGDTDFTALVAKVRASGAQAVFFGGMYPDAGPLSRQLKQGGVDGPLMGGDGLYAPEFAQAAAPGDLTVSTTVPGSRMPGAKQFLAAFAKGGYTSDPEQYGAYAYDATTAIVRAVGAVAAAHGRALPADARAEVVRALAELSFDGVTGPVAFDQYGDLAQPTLGVLAVRNAAWAQESTVRLTR
ncbi:bifunctional serine/threonine-protein kinase/ABC transporter substrate-binding protein [Kitasatospora sp. NPDC088134]|uniref:bifunctional serine/threonine-protein kinase/ABC transporter substrate-binding protein n=1 Tax=Kitasatospora sp. NPDC088134 TaxID=3364071 RepID=UPI0038253B66